MNQYTPEEQELIRLSDNDHRIIIKNFVKGKPFSMETIRSLYFQEAKQECLDYNETLKELNYYIERVESFSKYIETMKGILR